MIVSLLACHEPSATVAPEVLETPAQTCDSGPRARMALSTHEVDFGNVPIGGLGAAEVVLTNEGDATLGIDMISTGASEYAVTWEIGGCATADGDVLVLAPGCAVPVTLTYAPVEGGDGEAALMVASWATSWPEDAEYESDLLHRWDVVWLSGRRDAGLDRQPEFVGPVRAERTAIKPGDSTTLEVRVHPDTGDVNIWHSDGTGSFVPENTRVTEFTAYELESWPTYGLANIFTVLGEGTEPDAWSYATLEVYPDERYPCE